MNDADSTELASGIKTQKRDTPIWTALDAIGLRARGLVVTDPRLRFRIPPRGPFCRSTSTESPGSR